MSLKPSVWRISFLAHSSRTLKVLNSSPPAVARSRLMLTMNAFTQSLKQGPSLISMPSWMTSRRSSDFNFPPSAAFPFLQDNVSRRVMGAWWSPRSSKPLSARLPGRGRFDSFPLRPSSLGAQRPKEASRVVAEASTRTRRRRTDARLRSRPRRDQSVKRLVKASPSNFSNRNVADAGCSEVVHAC